VRRRLLTSSGARLKCYQSCSSVHRERSSTLVILILLPFMAKCKKDQFVELLQPGIMT
jgi:hypothetical protein